MSLTYQNLRDFLIEELALDGEEITADTLLFSSGLVDSFALVTLMTYIENDGGVTIVPTDVKLENFDSISRILAYLASSAS
ncbi:acyl carrier protein [Asticcacaulis sp.]|uniref:acyl carrier protein n=1 Tax=Asticcacaulis sp. TaxID=1872648 RepID=UPI002C42C2E3|nr:acyl carrier protein [Asticcacaulis sp.]HTM81094.1 acyl carrier protein [Asticcacaulis sp.]